MGFISNVIDSISGGKKAGKEAQKAAGQLASGIEAGTAQQVAGRQQGLDYMLGVNEAPSAIRTSSLENLAGLYGLEGGVGDMGTFLDQSRQSPLYAAIMGTRQSGEDAILRNAAATGGLRSGNVQSNLYDFNQRLDERALLTSYEDRLSGLRDLSDTSTMDQSIADYYAGIGETAGQGTIDAATARSGGTVAAGQAIQSGRAGLIDAGASILGGSKWSDGRLKTELEPLRKVGPLTWYKWKWNALAASLGLTGDSEGFLAQEVAEAYPDAVGMRGGYLTVDYDFPVV